MLSATWVAPSVNNFRKVYPNNNNALANIQRFTADGQRLGSTGQLNTIWNDDGEGLFNQDWYGILFGAAAAWQKGESSIPDFQNSYAQVFHGDATGDLNEAQKEMMLAHSVLKDQAKEGDGTNSIFWLDPMSKDGLLWKWASAIHPRFRTPWITTIVFGIFAGVMPAFLPIDNLADLVNIGTLLAFTIVCAGVWVLRVRSPELHRPFKTPLVPLVPILGILSAGYLMTQLAAITWIVMISWLLFGLIIYFTYSVKHSKVQRLPAGTK